MGERTDQIESQIKEERDELRANLDELGARVRSATDWRRQFRNNPMTGIGLAFAGGLLLAGVLRRTPHDVSSAPRASGSGRGQLLNAWEAIQSALIGVATSKVSGLLSDMVPGFREHFSARGRTHGSPRSGNGDGMQGEGNYEAARAAQPREEAEELEAAEDEGRSRASAARKRYS